MKYRGIINFDFSASDANKHTRLSLALREAGWTHVETSAFSRDTEDLDDLWEGVGIVARAAHDVGTLSAFTFHIQAAQADFSTSVSLNSTQSPKNALAEIKQRKFPRDP